MQLGLSRILFHRHRAKGSPTEISLFLTNSYGGSGHEMVLLFFAGRGGDSKLDANMFLGVILIMGCFPRNEGPKVKVHAVCVGVIDHDLIFFRFFLDVFHS